jgi:hypothetical protein
VIHANAPGNRVKPWKHRIARAIGVPDLVNAKPGFLQQVIRVGTNSRLRNKEPVQLRAQLSNENRGSVEIALLILGHEYLEIAVRRHAMDRLPAILIDWSRFVQTSSRNPALACGALSMPMNLIRWSAIESYVSRLNSWIC